MKDHYKTLGLEEDASKKEIQARWIRLVEHCRLDPEKTQEADEKIKEINEAYEVLGNERA